jgi:hypothetical protein
LIVSRSARVSRKPNHSALCLAFSVFGRAMIHRRKFVFLFLSTRSFYAVRLRLRFRWCGTRRRAFGSCFSAMRVNARADHYAVAREGGGGIGDCTRGLPLCRDRFCETKTYLATV